VKSVGRRFAPGFLLLPGGAWLLAFFAIPMGFMLLISLQTGTFDTGYQLTWNFGIYPEVVAEYWELYARSFVFAMLTTLITLAIGYPVAYFIAFRGGRMKSILLLLVILPFFVSFVIRTLNWRMILSDNGLVFGPLKDIGLLAPDFHFLATPASVVFGLTYNFLPFMILPLYVALEKVDRNLIEAANDLYASRISAFWRITFLLSLPGVFAGSLLVFIPAMGDFITAEVIGAGNPQVFMVGNIIQRKFLDSLDYPSAAALAFVLVAIVMVLIAIYARVVGSERLTS
jgi:spermidine/putrescine transport system permease protein